MAETALRRLAVVRARSLRRSVGEQIRDLREERGLSLRELATASGVHPSVIGRAEIADGNLTLETLAKVATALGAEASVRLYPATGLRLRDHVQVQLIETLLGRMHPRWRVRLEVPVYRPVRGVIDVVLADATAGELVGAEAHGEIRRAERQLRWAAEKVDALPSADGWPCMESRPRTTRLLILRSTSVTRSLMHSTPLLFSAAYPGRTADAVQALTTASGGLSEAAVVWIDLRGTESRLLDGPPRGVLVGR